MPRQKEAPVAIRPFREAWSAENLREHLRAQSLAPCFDSDIPKSDAEFIRLADWSEKTMEPQNDILRRALVGHIRWLAAQGKVKMPAHAEHVQLNWLHALGELVAGREGDFPLMAAEPFAQGLDLITKAAASVVAESADAPIDRIHERLVEFVEAGVFPAGGFQECFLSGMRIGAQVVDWQFTLGVSEQRKFRPLRAGEVSPPGVKTLSIDLPTGELWIADWFRIDAFSEACKAVETGLPSLNSEAGTRARTEALARELGFAHVFVGNTCPSVVLDAQGRMVVGSLKDRNSKAAGERVGSVCTDLWWTTIIDRQTLVDLVARTMPRQQAEKIVAEYGAEEDVLKVQLPPGQGHLAFAGNPETFAKRFRSPDLSLAPFSSPMFAFSSQPIRLSADIARAKQAATAERAAARASAKLAAAAKAASTDAASAGASEKTAPSTKARLAQSATAASPEGSEGGDAWPAISPKPSKKPGALKTKAVAAGPAPASSLSSTEAPEAPVRKARRAARP
jgi:hypothetical protein